MTNLLRKLETYYRLGLGNAASVLAYRLQLRNRHFIKSLPIASPLKCDDFFTPSNAPTQGVERLRTLSTFGSKEVDLGQPPNWHASVINNKVIENNATHWSELDDFSLNIGDIKGVWELSRMDWLLHFSINYLATGNEENLARLNQWLADWIKNNPCNQGVNWKCGQEASIRVIHLVITAQIMGQFKQASSALTTIVEQHLQRIAPTLSYAKAQDNNHGTSEAAALLIGALFLKANANHKQYDKWILDGQKLLENRVCRLIDVDGNFSQNSVNYHRLMLDTLSVAEYFREKTSHKKFSALFYQKAKLATLWLRNLVNETNGHVPNFGLNDGANLLPLTNSDYRDYRPSVQFATLMFLDTLTYPNHACTTQLSALLAIAPKNSKDQEDTWPLKGGQYYQTGLLKISNSNFSAYLRVHDRKFRPSACDALHLDLWCGDQNIFIGTGSYSYNSEDSLKDYFNSTEAHNTVQFDGQQQMPKLSRFLYGDWLKCSHHQEEYFLSASYKNNKGHQHDRKIILHSEHEISVSDEISGFINKAQLRWHLSDKTWQLNGNRLSLRDFEIELNCDQGALSISLVDGWSSYYYAEKRSCAVLVAEVNQPCTITTKITRHICA